MEYVIPSAAFNFPVLADLLKALGCEAGNTHINTVAKIRRSLCTIMCDLVYLHSIPHTSVRHPSSYLHSAGEQRALAEVQRT